MTVDEVDVRGDRNSIQHLLPKILVREWGGDNEKRDLAAVAVTQKGLSSPRTAKPVS
jgi:hypothetical protein